MRDLDTRSGGRPPALRRIVVEDGTGLGEDEPTPPPLRERLPALLIAVPAFGLAAGLIFVPSFFLEDQISQHGFLGGQEAMLYWLGFLVAWFAIPAAVGGWAARYAYRWAKRRFVPRRSDVA
jgi:uncharacterized RDD family membrane protein YckC